MVKRYCNSTTAIGCNIVVIKEFSITWLTAHFFIPVFKLFLIFFIGLTTLLGLRFCIFLAHKSLTLKECCETILLEI